MGGGDWQVGRRRVSCGRRGEAKEGSQQRTDRQRTCFLMSQLITFTPEWQERAGEDGGVGERVTQAPMLFHGRTFLCPLSETIFTFTGVHHGIRTVVSLFRVSFTEQNLGFCVKSFFRNSRPSYSAFKFLATDINRVFYCLWISANILLCASFRGIIDRQTKFFTHSATNFPTCWWITSTVLLLFFFAFFYFPSPEREGEKSN